MVETEKPMAAVPRYKASLSQPAQDAKKRELNTQPTWKICHGANKMEQDLAAEDDCGRRQKV